MFKRYKIEESITGIVVKVNDSSYTVKLNNQKILLYTNDTLSLGDRIYATGTYREICYPTVPFDYNDYYLKHDTKYQFYAKELSVKKSFNIYFIRNKLIKLFDSYNKPESDFYKSLLLGYNDDLEIKDELTLLGISHMFAISGLHILILVKILSFIIKKRYLINIFLVIYMCITGFSPSVMRASLLVILNNIFKWKKLEFSSLDTFSFVFIFLLFINPYYIYDIGFELSFLISFSLLITEFKNKFKTLQVSLLSFFMSLPLVVNMNNQINLLSPFYNILLIGFFSTIFLPFTIFTCFIKNFKPYELTAKLFIKVIEYLSKIKFCVIEVPSFTPLHTILYYISIFIFFTSKKALYIVIVLCLVFVGKGFSIASNVKIFDCGQGDSSLIKTASGVVMIDCYNDTYKYLIKNGIRKIDYLIITHGHNDHASDALEILESNIKVKHLILSYYDTTSLSKEIAKSYNDVTYFKKGDSIELGNIKIKCLAPNSANTNINNQSLVLRIDVGKKSYLFMGDYELEETLVNNALIKCDVLKVGHHGSENANSKIFLDAVNPKEAVISVGKYNKYNLPDKSVCDYLLSKGIKLHITYEKKTYVSKCYF